MGIFLLEGGGEMGGQHLGYAINDGIACGTGWASHPDFIGVREEIEIRRATLGAGQKLKQILIQAFTFRT
jgi:hypothetical protein